MLTVLFATYNRAHLLSSVLRDFCGLIQPPGGWKLVIVDNGSADDTKDVIASFIQQLPLTYVFEPRPGKNRALNSGLSYLEGDLVVFTDDDVLPKADWLVQMRLAADAHPEFSVLGGVIFPKWEIPPEEWITKWNIPLGPVFSITGPKLEEGPISPHAVFGPNMAVRTDIFTQGYRFEESIGPSRSNYPMGSETEFTKRLLKLGHRAWHCRNSIVYHVIRSSQMRKDWVLQRMIRFGRGEFRQSVSDWRARPRMIGGIPGYLIRMIGRQYFQLLLSLCGRDSETMFEARMELNHLLGRALESRLMSQRGEFSRLPFTRANGVERMVKSDNLPDGQLQAKDCWPGS